MSHWLSHGTKVKSRTSMIKTWSNSTEKDASSSPWDIGRRSITLRLHLATTGKSQGRLKSTTNLLEFSIG
ncbi:hypothetical protein VTO42DRAFT_3404 [Malbranchea cinnamomea]